MPELMYAGYYIASMRQMTPTPPPIWGAKSAFTPIIFRTKNTEKSRLGRLEKNFGKNLQENVSGKRKPPILWRGGKGC